MKPYLKLLTDLGCDWTGKFPTEKELKAEYKKGTRSVKKQIKKTGQRPIIKPYNH